jgi:hypothetical protein
VLNAHSRQTYIPFRSQCRFVSNSTIAKQPVRPDQAVSSGYPPVSRVASAENLHPGLHTILAYEFTIEVATLCPDSCSNEETPLEL